MKNVEVIVATHKAYEFPKEKSYVPMQVGAKNSNLNLNIARDDVGDNISDKNPYFCELTALYSLWKNSKAKYKGLVHYRRYFTLHKNIPKEDRLSCVLTDKEIEELTKSYDIILPNKRRYIIENLWSHYNHTLHIEPLKKTGEIIEKEYPTYFAEFKNLKSRKSAHMFNMLIAKSEIVDEYSDWLFNILFKLEKELKKNKDAPKYSGFHARFYGRISELLFDVWLYTKYPELKKSNESDRIKVKELKIVDIEGVNWLKKGSSFLLAKFTGRKYEKSF
jgi:hypothetical protein